MAELHPASGSIVFESRSILPAAGGAPKQMVVLLHGYGTDGSDLLPFVHQWAPQLPHAEFLLPHAPFPYEVSPFGRQWFSFQTRSQAQMLAEVRPVARALDHMLSGELRARALDDTALALVGFSQGAMMALFLAVRRANPVAAVVSYAGKLLAPETLPAELCAKPKTLLVHGTVDRTVRANALSEAYEVLIRAGVPVDQSVCTGPDHGFSEEGAAQGLNFLRAAFGIS